MAKRPTEHTSAKNLPKKGKGKGYGRQSWQQGWQQIGVRSICGLTEAKAKTDEEGFTAVRTEKTVKPADCRPALETSLLDCRPAVKVNSGSFERLQEEDEDDEEEEVPGFQCQASIFEEKERKQKEHAKREKEKTVAPPPPPLPPNGTKRVKHNQEPKRKYVSMLMTPETATANVSITK